MPRYKSNIQALVFFSGLLLISFGAVAQNPISTERPTQSISAIVLPSNSFQVEQGFTYANDSLNLDGFFRLGISNLGEISLLTYYDSPDVTIGAKVNLLKDKDYQPGIAIKVELTGAKVSDYRLSIGQKLSERFSATVNLGYSQQFYSIVAVGYGISDRFATFLEGYFEDSYNQFNTGITFAINSETQLDLSAGLLGSDASYFGVGLARRFMFKE